MKAYKENEEAREQFYNKNPDAKNAVGKKGVRTEKEIMSVVGTEEDRKAAAAAAQNETVSVADKAGAVGAGLFDVPDLALQRKMEREAAKKE
jgi:hypothetical protein